MFDQILSILFPERCRGCQKPGIALCADCVARIPAADPIVDALPSLAFFNYSNSVVQTIVRELKYHHNSAAAKILTLYGAPYIHDYLASLLQSHIPVKILLVPIPQHYTKTFSRGFNQSMLIAKWIQSVLPEATIAPLLRKTRSTVAQARVHNRQERMQNLQHSMNVVGTIDTTALYILIDDVITTGSTMQEAGRALRAAGAGNICAMALAHGYAKG